LPLHPRLSPPPCRMTQRTSSTAGQRWPCGASSSASRRTWWLARSLGGTPKVSDPEFRRSSENGLKEELSAGLKALCQRMRCYSACRGMYLELRRRPMSREHARPQPPAVSRRYGGGAEQEPAPVPIGVTGHRTQRPRGQVGPPGPHPAHPSPPLDPGGERWPNPRPVVPLVVQLVVGLRRKPTASGHRRAARDNDRQHGQQQQRGSCSAFGTRGRDIRWLLFH
jgi:hypothetical protein